MQEGLKRARASALFFLRALGMVYLTNSSRNIYCVRFI